MTEVEWWTSENPTRCLDFLGIKPGLRKRRLFAVACCRRIEEIILRFKSAYRAVVLAEGIADGATVTEEARRLVQSLPESAFTWIDGYRQEKQNQTMWHSGNAAAGCLAGIGGGRPVWARSIPTLNEVSELTCHAIAHWSRRHDRDPVQDCWVLQERAAQLPLLYCVFGNPFRPVTFSPEWRTSTAVVLAQQMYDSRDFALMPILGDALQDAGCDSDDILDHCRGAGPHVRGCWVVDLVLGKE